MSTLKEIPGYESYLASDTGGIYSKKRKRFLKKSISKYGYERVTLYKEDGEKHKIMVHRLVALAFLENPNNYPQVNHKNENRVDNCVDNLEWCSPSYNINYGNRNSIVSAKLRDHKEKTTAKRIEQVDISTGNVLRVWTSMREIERELKYSHSNIYACCTGRRKTRGGYMWRYQSTQNQKLQGLVDQQGGGEK